VCFTHSGSSLVSADADGIVKLWDVRMVAEVLTINCSKYPANKAVFDASSLVGGQQVIGGLLVLVNGKL
jgi:WD40 repeat protein